MASLNTLRTRFGVLLSVVIGGALLAFILSLKTEMGFTGNDPKVGEIDGEKILYSEYLAAYEDVKTQMGGDNFDYDQAEQLIVNTWQSLVTDHVFVPGYEQLGLGVSEQEHTDMLLGERESGIYSSVFADPRTGEYNVAAVTEFLAQVSTNPQVEKFWTLVEKQAKIERMMNKYMALVRGGAYVTSLELNKGLVAKNNTFKGRVVACKYNTIADSLVNVSAGDVKAYYKAHKEQYKQTPYRTISYVEFEVEPTAEDKAAIEQEAKEAGKAFAAATDIRAYVRENRHASISNNYLLTKQLSADEAKALNAGKTYGPELEGDEWHASRVVEVRNVPDTLELQHIVLSYTDEKLADSLLVVARAKGADFAALAEKYSIAETATEGGNIGKVAYSSLGPEFADALKGARKGQIEKITFGNAIQLMKVVSTGRVQKHVKLASLTYAVEPSAATKRAIHTKASSFAVEAAGSVEKFNETATATANHARSANIEQGERRVSGLSNSIEVVRWANDAKVGDVSELFSLDDSYVVAVVTAIDDAEYKSLKSVESQIRNTLLREKKFAQLSEKMQGATLEEVAEAAGSKIEEFSDAKSSAYYLKGVGVEPRVIGVIATATPETTGKLSPVIEGTSGAYVVVVDEVKVAEEQTLEAERVKAQADAEAMAPRRAMYAVQDAAELKDLSVKYF
ncbi:MAG: SurA N-terminal domain-containing protein [Alistipes sp.]|nr:SurA N-terminal domain-containing protein [Alistipes sp.]